MPQPTNPQIITLLDNLQKGDHLALFWGTSGVPIDRCCVIYLRVSSKRQLNGEGLQDQWTSSVTHAERQGWTVVGLYVDPAISGRKQSRPAIDQLKRDAQRRRFRYALCYKVNRIGHNAKASYATADEIEQHGVVVVSSTETFNRQTASGNLTFGMLVIFAQFGSDQLKEVMINRLQNKAKAGGWVGPVPFGYTKDVQGRLVPSTQAPEVAAMFARYQAGQSYMQVADWLNERGLRTQSGSFFSRESVRTILRNRAYLGFVSSGKVECPGTHEPLVSQELWDAAAGIRRGRTMSPTTRHPDHEASDAWLSGLVRCGVCGEKLWHRTGKRGNRGRYYRCAGYDHRTCDVRDMVPSASLEEQLHTALSQLVLPEELLPRIISEARALVAQGQETAEKPIDPAAVQAKLRRLGLVYADGVIDDETYRKERTRLQVLLAEAASAPPRLAFCEEQALKILQNMVGLVKATTEELRDVVRALFTHICVQNRVIHAGTPRAEVYPILAARSGVVWRVPDGFQKLHVTPIYPLEIYPTLQRPAA